MDFEKQVTLAAKRTQKNMSDAWGHASTHPVEASLVIGPLVTLMAFMPVPVVLALLVSALVLMGINSLLLRGRQSR